MRDMSMLAWVALILILVGGINWGLVGLFNFNVVALILGTGFLARLVYIIIGVAACYKIYLMVQKTRNP